MNHSSAIRCAALALPLLTLAVRAQDPAPAVPCDRTAIHWILPGDFDQALARARDEQRILIVKGISFGVDTEGARCATKGVW